MAPWHRVLRPQLPHVSVLGKNDVVVGVSGHGANSLQVFKNVINFLWELLCIDNDVHRENIGPLVDILACVVLNMHKGLPNM